LVAISHSRNHPLSNNLETKPKGVLKISLCTPFGEIYIVPMIIEFLAFHSELKVQLNFTNRYVDIVDEGFDLAIRLGELKDSSLMAKKIVETRLHVCGSHRYFEEHGMPEIPEDIQQHNCLVYSTDRSGQKWTFGKNGNTFEVQAKGNWDANSVTALLAGARQGIGLVWLPDYYLKDDFSNGILQPILEEWTEIYTAIWAIYPQSRFLSAKVRLFVDHLIQRFRDSFPGQHHTSSKQLALRWSGKMQWP